jgi:hypothetical protein
VQRKIARVTFGLRRLSPPKEPPARFVWLGVHADTKDVPRIRSVTRALVEGLSAIAAELAPSAGASSWRRKVGAPTSGAAALGLKLRRSEARREIRRRDGG